jgi:ABC-type multidrug transport system fused ATPase/permease subunit
MLENEFSRITMSCSSESLIPNGEGYANISHQICTLPGATPGALHVAGAAYLEKAFSYAPSQLWRNWGIIIAIIVFFLILNVVLGEFVTYGTGSNSVLSRVKQTAKSKALNESLLKKREEYRKNKMRAESSELQVASQSVLTWEALNYDVPVHGSTRRLLNNVYGYVKPAELTALMGASGAGKTTLLDVLAGRKNVGVIVSWIKGVYNSREDLFKCAEVSDCFSFHAN